MDARYVIRSLGQLCVMRGAGLPRRFNRFPYWLRKQLHSSIYVRGTVPFRVKADYCPFIAYFAVVNLFGYLAHFFSASGRACGSGKDV